MDVRMHIYTTHTHTHTQYEKLKKKTYLVLFQFLQLVLSLKDCWHEFLKFLWFLIRVGQPVNNLVSYAQSTITVISGRPRHELCQ